MAAFLTHRSGAMSDYAAATDIEELVAELDAVEDPEHPDVAVSDASGWTLSAFPGGLLIWENVELDDVARHRKSVPRHELIALFTALVQGDVATIEQGAWMPGYGA